MIHTWFSTATLEATARKLTGEVWYPMGEVWENWGTGGRARSDYKKDFTDKEGDEHILAFSEFGITVSTPTVFKVTCWQNGVTQAIGFHYVLWDGVNEVDLDEATEFLRAVLEGDAVIDKSNSPYQLVIKRKGTETELIRKDLFDVDGNAITATTTVIGQQKEPE